MDDTPRCPEPLTGWKTALAAELDHVALRDRWGLALMLIGWAHLGTFLICQAMFSAGLRNNLPYLTLWGLELAVNLGIMRRVAGRGWARSTPLAMVLVRVWATFLILSFNVASLNSLTGWEIHWFKPVWATLGTFGFATTAYLTSLWFFVPAVQMYFTGLLMVTFPGYEYAIHGLSWCLAFQGIGGILERRRARKSSAGMGPFEARSAAA